MADFTEVRPTRTQRRVLDAWRRRAGDYADTRWGPELIEPYVIRLRHLGCDFDVLIPTLTAQVWYDRLGLLGDLDRMLQLGMVRPGDTVFDFGAHHGIYSLVMASVVGPSGRVYAFDPFALNADVIRCNAVLNELPIEVIHVGLSNRTERVAASSVHECVGAIESPYSETVTLDVPDRFESLAPTMIKMDIEGAEIDALGAAEQLLARRPNLHVEVHFDYYDRFGHRAEQLFDVLPMDAGYHCYYSPGGNFGEGGPLRPLTRELELNDYYSLFFVLEPPDRRLPASL